MLSSESKEDTAASLAAQGSDAPTSGVPGPMKLLDYRRSILPVEKAVALTGAVGHPSFTRTKPGISSGFFILGQEDYFCV